VWESKDFSVRAKRGGKVPGDVIADSRIESRSVAARGVVAQIFSRKLCVTDSTIVMSSRKAKVVGQIKNYL
jgi:hypothetical protein